MPKIGMAGATMLLAPYREGIRFAREHGFQAFEIFAEFPQCVPEEVSHTERELVREEKEKSGLEILVHAPLSSINIAALNTGIRRESVRQEIAAVEFCADLGGEVVILHNGDYVVDQEFINANPQVAELTWRLNIESLKRIAEAAEKRGVILGLENIGFEPSKLDQNAEDMVRIRDAVGSDRILFTLDIGHARLCEGVERYISLLGDSIRHIHFTDNFGRRDDHVVIGEGNFDYTPFLDFIRDFPHVVTLEVVKMGTDGTPALTSRENFLRLLEERVFR
jgi:sugar phosphate isomerase/epimerase